MHLQSDLRMEPTSNTIFQLTSSFESRAVESNEELAEYYNTTAPLQNKLSKKLSKTTPQIANERKAPISGTRDFKVEGPHITEAVLNSRYGLMQGKFRGSLAGWNNQRPDRHEHLTRFISDCRYSSRNKPGLSHHRNLSEVLKSTDSKEVYVPEIFKVPFKKPIANLELLKLGSQ